MRTIRHPELVSGSSLGCEEMLNRVQHDVLPFQHDVLPFQHDALLTNRELLPLNDGCTTAPTAAE
jgi:hypothetical protein